MEPQLELIAKTFQGLEEVLAQEITELGGDNVQIGRRMVSFTGDKEMMYRANFCLRTAVRVLKAISHFRAADADAVYEAVKRIDWERYMDLGTTFSVDSVVYSTEFRHSKFVAYKVKDAIADYFREKTGRRPDIRVTNPDLRLNIHIAETDCTLSLDSSGESLHLRGYRTASVEAPINEVLAAGLVKMSGWDFRSDLIDPFCGSGTILVEAALMARNIHPGIFRKEFGFERWKDFDPDLLQRIYDDDSGEREFTHRIYGYDLNLRAVESALANAKAAGVADCMELKQQDIRKFEQPAMPALIITNPPYGERLVSQDTLDVYRTLGERLKHAFIGGTAWIICSREELFEQVGLKPSLRIPLCNASLDCDFRKYQIFDGKFQDFRASGGDVKSEEERTLMAEKRRFKQRREFKERFDDKPEEEEEMAIPDYLVRMHRDFERKQDRFRRGHEDRFRENRGREYRRDGRDDRQPGRRYGDRTGTRGDRYDRRDSRYESGRGGYPDRRDDGFRRFRNDRDGFRPERRFDPAARRPGRSGRDDRRGPAGRTFDGKPRKDRP